MKFWNLAILSCLLAQFFCLSAQARTHTVAKSETCYSISRHYGISVSQLMSANGITDATKLQLGQKITIPSKTVSTKKTAPAAKQSADKAVSLQKTSRPAIANKSRTIIIDPGHGGRDRGASRSGIHEADLTLQVALKLEKQLKNEGFRVVLTRRSNTYLSLSKRAAIANRYRNALFVSVHFNATDNQQCSVHGTEVYYASASGRHLARLIHPLLAAQCKTRNRGVRLARYSVLMNTHCPAVLIECGYLSNRNERGRLASSSHQQKIAAAIAKGIVRYDQKH